MVSWSPIVESLCALHFRLRNRFKRLDLPEPEPWSTWLAVPVRNYLETGSTGPVPTRMIEWVDIDPVETVLAARMIPAPCLDRTDAILEALRTCCVRTEIVSGLVRARIES